MDPLLTSPREREASRLLRSLFGLTTDPDMNDRGNDPLFDPPITGKARGEAVDRFVHELIEAAAEKGRGQIQSS